LKKNHGETPNVEPVVRTLVGSKPTTGFCHLHYVQFCHACILWNLPLGRRCTRNRSLLQNRFSLTTTQQPHRTEGYGHCKLSVPNQEPLCDQSSHDRICPHGASSWKATSPPFLERHRTAHQNEHLQLQADSMHTGRHGTPVKIPVRQARSRRDLPSPRQRHPPRDSS
jgi:hypothetical protein